MLGQLVQMSEVLLLAFSLDGIDGNIKQCIMISIYDMRKFWRICENMYFNYKIEIVLIWSAYY